MIVLLGLQPNDNIVELKRGQIYLVTDEKGQRYLVALHEQDGYYGTVHMLFSFVHGTPSTDSVTAYWNHGYFGPLGIGRRARYFLPSRSGNTVLHYTGRITTVEWFEGVTELPSMQYYVSQVLHIPQLLTM